MRIGIRIEIQHSFFSGGLATCAYSLATRLAGLEHDITFVNTSTSGLSWFEDCVGCKERFPAVLLGKVQEPFDLFIDIDGVIPVDARGRLGTRYVVFVRHPVLLHETESCVYPLAQPTPNFRVCDAVWIWEHFGAQDAHLMELLSERPVVRVPYVWTAEPIDVYVKEAGLPSWLETTRDCDAKAASDGKVVPWACHSIENNMTNASNCTLSLVTLAHTKRQGDGVLPLYHAFFHNAGHLEKQEFFKKNIFEHTHVEGLERSFLGRQRVSDWRKEGKSFLLSHMRFVAIRPALLDALWNGIPVVHNSPILAALGLGYFYPDNVITKATEAMGRMNTDWVERKGYFAPDSLDSVRAKIREVFTGGTAVWAAALDGVQGAPAAALQGASKAAPVPTQISVSAVPAYSKVLETPVPKESKTLRVGFSDLWQNANCSYNFWTLLLTEALKKAGSSLSVDPVEITPANASSIGSTLDMLFFGPFGQTWKQVPSSVPKIHITGENTPPIMDADVALNLGFAHTNKPKVVRCPLWLQYLDWFGADQDRFGNPKTLPLVSMFGPSRSAEERAKFCAFIVSNPTNSVRNEAFHALSTYKHVDSAGRFLNNVGTDIFCESAGGGGGELAKHAFLHSYKFCLAYENSQTLGYITEKLLAAKAAGCVPIYWGAPDISSDFVEGAFLNATFLTQDQMVQAVKEIDTNPALYESYRNTPLIAGGLDRCRAWLSEIAKAIFETSSATRDLVSRIPSHLGSEDVKAPVTSAAVVTKPPSIVYTTFATNAYMASLQMWLGSVIPRMTPETQIHVYLGADVRPESEKVLKEQFSGVLFHRLPDLHVPDFPDLWNPQHFAWKLWITQTLATDPSIKGALVYYTDSGCIHVRYPTEYLQLVKQHGVAFVEDNSQKNDQWCHEDFRKALKTTDAELNAQQLWAGCYAFVSGHERAVSVFKEAWGWAQKRSVIVGPKWQGVLSDGRPYGHRHDQSILSILRLRHAIPVVPIHTMYCDESLRFTYKSGAALYCHRGRFVENKPFAPGIGDAQLISLARRADRVATFKHNHPEEWRKRVSLRPAFDGRALTLTPALARLFAPNDFFWKKAVMGCALSHLQLWTELAAEKECCDSYLILEDDVKFQPGWMDVWAEASKTIPDDYDVLYLGGILPPNRNGFQALLEPVAPHWSRVALNQAFGQPIPTRYFHVCNYAYILRRSGAKKILEAIQREGGYKTSADHMICNRVQELTMYAITPLVAGCIQDEDPVYQRSAFNDFSRLDKFDSDLWNNDERFDVAEAQSLGSTASLDVKRALADAAQPRQASAPETFLGRQATFLGVGTHNTPDFLEKSWLRDLFGSVLDSYACVPIDHEPQTNTPIFLVQRPHIDDYIAVFERYEKAKQPFCAIHLSDEFLTDPIGWYGLSMCKRVWRNYMRPLDPAVEDKVVVIPLGYAVSLPTTCVPLSDRPFLWSFHATKWFNRGEVVEALKDKGPNSYGIYEDWMSPDQLSKEVYTDILSKSMFVPCPRGQNAETFRFYEALEYGCIPLVVQNESTIPFLSYVSRHVPLAVGVSWESVAQMMEGLSENKESLAGLCATIQSTWKAWKAELRDKCRVPLD